MQDAGWKYILDLMMVNELCVGESINAPLLNDHYQFTENSLVKLC